MSARAQKRRKTLAKMHVCRVYGPRTINRKARRGRGEIQAIRDAIRETLEAFGESVEVDAIPPQQLRQLVAGCIERHVEQRAYEVTKVAEQSERQLLTTFASNWPARPEQEVGLA